MSSKRLLSGGQAVVEALRGERVEHVFGLIGSATMELFDALYDAKDIRFLDVRDERSGTHMADGYARARGRTGVIIAGQNGPGVTNLATGLAQAKAAYSPVLALAGSLSTSHVYRDAFQEVDQETMFRPITKRTWTVPSIARVQEMMLEAFRNTMTPRQGPVLLNLPRDVLAQSAEFESLPPPQSYRVGNAPAAGEEILEQAVELLCGARRPLILAGGGIKNTAGDAPVLALAEALGAPIVTSAGHGDAVPFSHRLNMGQTGPRGNPLASKLAREADVILALGTRLGFNSTFYSYEHLNRDAALIHVELEPCAIGRYFPVALGVWADAATVARQLCAMVEKRQLQDEAKAWGEAGERARAAYLLERDEAAVTDADLIQPSGLFKTLRDVLPKDAAITLDAGTLCLQATDALNYWQPRSLFTPLDFGLVGFSFACGLGVKLACPDRPVVSLMGDGGFGMTVGELSTAVAHDIHTITLVLNNGCWGAEKAYQRDFFQGRYIGADIASPRFDQVAELYGAKGYRAVNLSEVKEALAEALSREAPAVIDVAMDPDALFSFRRDSFAHRGG